MKNLLLSLIMMVSVVFAYSQTPLYHFPMNGDITNVGSINQQGIEFGTLVPVADRFGNVDSAMYFNGDSSYVKMGPNAPFYHSFEDAIYSISMWVLIEEPEVDIEKTQDNIQKLEAELKDVQEEMKGYLKQLGIS